MMTIDDFRKWLTAEWQTFAQIRKRLNRGERTAYRRLEDLRASGDVVTKRWSPDWRVPKYRLVVRP